MRHKLMVAPGHRMRGCYPPFNARLIQRTDEDVCATFVRAVGLRAEETALEAVDVRATTR